ncbi:MAG: hypothetical protein H0V01_12690 [Bacteroidetes bacterium]|nr:hypothetical protein [Bacteroidota bacterium]HET6244120.1 hypothetical protein [Bacteroidia bacterium]
MYNFSQHLQEIKSLVKSLTEEQYQFKSPLLSGASIGQHTRHILEFYLCLVEGRHKGIVNYDKRERNLDIETNLKFAIYTIDKICSNVSTYNICCELILEGNFSNEGEESVSVKTSYFRELAYNLEHSIHHQALIKIGLKEQNLDHLIPDNFGIAAATIRYKGKCAQ